MSNNYKFSLGNFEKWLKEEMARDISFAIGEHVYPKISFKKIIERVEIEDGDAFEIAKSFRKLGGKILTVENDHILVKCKKGKFFINENDITKEQDSF